jgi:hypothetical protein
MAGVFFYLLQSFVLGESRETSVMWGIAGGAAAALLAWLQQRRGR